MIEINQVAGYVKMTFVQWADKPINDVLLEVALLETWDQVRHEMPGVPTSFGSSLQVSINQVPLNVAVNCHADGPHDRLLVFQMAQPANVLEQGYTRGKGVVRDWHFRIMVMLGMNDALFRSANVKSQRVMFPKANEAIDIEQGWAESLGLPNEVDSSLAKDPALGAKHNRALTCRVLHQVPSDKLDLYKRQRAMALRFIYGPAAA